VKLDSGNLTNRIYKALGLDYVAFNGDSSWWCMAVSRYQRIWRRALTVKAADAYRLVNVEGDVARFREAYNPTLVYRIYIFVRATHDNLVLETRYTNIPRTLAFVGPSYFKVEDADLNSEDEVAKELEQVTDEVNNLARRLIYLICADKAGHGRELTLLEELQLL
jgi:hypothetical protein